MLPQDWAARIVPWITSEESGGPKAENLGDLRSRVTRGEAKLGVGDPREALPRQPGPLSVSPRVTVSLSYYVSLCPVSW